MAEDEGAETVAPKTRRMLPTIHSAVQFRATRFDPGQEDELMAAGIPGSDMQRLTDLGVISGFNFDPSEEETKL